MEKIILSREEYSRLVMDGIRSIRQQAKAEGKPVNLQQAADQARELVATFYEREEQCREH